MADPAHKADADAQPEITLVNVHAGTSPAVFRCAHYDVSAPGTLVRLAGFVAAEDALLVSLSLTPRHLCLVAAFARAGWVERFQRAVQVEWPPAALE